MPESNNQGPPPNFSAFLANTLPVLSVNCIVFRFRSGQLEYVASRLKGTELWLLPGSYIFHEEDIDAAAQRVLVTDTGISGKRLSHFGTFGRADRSFADIVSDINGTKDYGAEIAERLSKRSVTVGYYSICGQEEVEMKPNFFFEEIAWVALTEPINLAMDHSDLLAGARAKLRSELQSQPVLRSFLPDTFTMPDLQALHEAILNRPVDRGNFRRRILKNNFLVEVGDSKLKTGSRPRKLYCFEEERYLDSLQEEAKLGF